jgi:ABC-type multidrug transport system fused ATPase/permease subunit
MKEKANRNDNTYHEIATDSLLNYETVKYFTNESYEINKYVASVAKYQQYNLKIMFSLNGLNATQQFIMQFTLAGVMIVAAHQVSEGTITLGDWVAIYSWVLTIFVPLNFLGTWSQQLLLHCYTVTRSRPSRPPSLPEIVVVVAMTMDSQPVTNDIFTTIFQLSYYTLTISFIPTCSYGLVALSTFHFPLTVCPSRPPPYSSHCYRNHLSIRGAGPD